jgi:hypothetical protein
MEVEVPDALTAVWAACVQDDDSSRPEAVNHGSADSLYQRDGLGEIVSRCVKDTYGMLCRHHERVAGSEGPCGERQEGNGLRFASHPRGFTCRHEVAEDAAIHAGMLS